MKISWGFCCKNNISIKSKIRYSVLAKYTNWLSGYCLYPFYAHAKRNGDLMYYALLITTDFYDPAEKVVIFIWKSYKSYGADQSLLCSVWVIFIMRRVDKIIQQLRAQQNCTGIRRRIQSQIHSVLLSLGFKLVFWFFAV